MSLQEYLNIETKRLKKDRSKLGESIKLNKNNNLNSIHEKIDNKDFEENDLVVYENNGDKDLDIKNEKKKLKFEKKGI